MALFEAESVMLPAANAKVLLIAFHPMMIAFSKPAAFLSRIGEGGEDPLRLDGIAALDDKSVVDYGLLVHDSYLLRGKLFSTSLNIDKSELFVKYALKYFQFVFLPG
jgi:predicted acyltransferase